MRFRYQFATLASVLVIGYYLYSGFASPRNQGRSLAASNSFSQRSQTIYQNDSANSIVHLMYPSKALPSGIAKVVHDPTLTTSWKSLDDTFEFHDAVQLPSLVPVVEIQFPAMPLESFGLMVVTNAERAESFMRTQVASQVQTLAGKLNSSRFLEESLLEKAFLQRDLLQTYTVFVCSLTHLKEPELIAKAKRVVSDLSPVLRKLLLDPAELAQLENIRRQHRNISRFRQDAALDTAADYLPARVVEDDDTWWSVDFRLKYNVHYGKYRGRSFIHIYARIPGMSHQKFRELWYLTATRLGAVSNAQPGLSTLPEGSEMMLVRTMGVLAQDLTMADSGIVEEVLIRGFRTRRAEFHPTSSDFRGTVHFQYLLDRSRYLSEPQDIGLVRIHDDSPSYVGFFPCAPDVDTSMNEFLIPSRFNCINCHSETLHGTPTVFSLGFEEVTNPVHVYDGHPFASFDDPTGRIRLATDEIRTLQESITRSLTGQ